MNISSFSFIFVAVVLANDPEWSQTLILCFQALDCGMPEIRSFVMALGIPDVCVACGARPMIELGDFALN